MHVAGPAPLPPQGRHVAAPDPSPEGGGSGPPRPVGAVRPVMVRPSHVAAPDLPGEFGPRGLPESSLAFRGIRWSWTSESSGRVRIPWSQLSGLGHMPRHPRGEGEITYGDTLRAWTP
jgi:hypothetical protein